jgi:hypothetical protein
MRPLVIGAVQKEQIAKLRALAAANAMDPVAMDAAAKKDINAYRDMMADLSIELPVGFLVTYTHQLQQIGSIQHISISVEAPNRTPHPAAVNMILEAFGMKSFDQSLKVWIEDVTPTEKAINVVQWLVS